MAISRQHKIGQGMFPHNDAGEWLPSFPWTFLLSDDWLFFGGTGSTFNLCLLRGSSFLSSPSTLTHFHLCLLSLTPNAECRSCQNCRCSVCQCIQEETAFTQFPTILWLYDPSLLILAELTWGSPVFPTCPLLISQHRLCSDPTVSSAPDHSFLEVWPAFPERTRAPHISSQGNMGVQAVRWEAGGGFGAPKGEEGAQSTHFRMEADCTASSCPDSSQHSSSSFVRKKSQMFRDAGTARTKQQLQSGIAFLDVPDAPF